MQLESSITLFDDNKVENRFAELQITADGITSEVSRKVGNDEVISRINQSAESVKIQADKINIEGAAIFTSGRLSTTSLDAAYDANGAATGAVNTLTNDLASASGTTVINGGHIATGSISIGQVDNLQSTLNGKAASGAENTANNYITDIGNDGIRVHDSHTSNNSAVINSSGMEVFKGGTTDAYSVAKYGESARVGKSSTGHIEIHGGTQGGGLQVYGASGSMLANIGYGNANAQSGTEIAPYFTFGTRKSGSEAGIYSVVEGTDGVASKAYSHAEGYQTSATALGAHAEGSNTEARSIDDHAEGGGSVASGGWSHAEGNDTIAAGMYSHAEGFETQANKMASHAGGMGTIANGVAQTVIGLNNQANTSSLFIIGGGSSDARKNVFEVSQNGYVSVNGTVVHSSDRRLKEHLSYVGDEAVEFINGLKPAHYIKDGEKHVGFYAQDVAKVDKWGCMVGEELNGYMTLGYTELIAPLVAYVQKLEKRIEELERSR